MNYLTVLSNLASLPSAPTLPPIPANLNIPWWLQWIFWFLHKTPTFAILLALIGIDVIIGTILSVVKGTLSSTVSWKGAVKKIITLLVVLSVYVVGDLIPQIPSFEMACMAFIISEFISILEGAALAGIPLPAILVMALVKLKEAQTAQNLLKSGGINPPAQPNITQINVIPSVPAATPSVPPGDSRATPASASAASVP